LEKGNCFITSKVVEKGVISAKHHKRGDDFRIERLLSGMVFQFLHNLPHSSFMFDHFLSPFSLSTSIYLSAHILAWIMQDGRLAEGLHTKLSVLLLKPLCQLTSRVG
jgi:hypothetical protein